MKRFKKRHPQASSKAPKQKRNWAQINANLIRRGDLTVWIDPQVERTWNHPEQSGKPGHPYEYSDVAIVTCQMIKSVYRLPLRQAQGFLASIFRLMKLRLKAPHYSTPSRRLTTVKVRLPKRKNLDDAIHMVIDSTGLKIYGAGEWHAHKHGLR